jgi:hypothetical protein
MYATFISWRIPVTDDPNGPPKETIKESAILAINMVDHPDCDNVLAEEIAQEYMYAEHGIVWGVWQALAAKHGISESVLRQLHEKRHWAIDIQLVHNPSTPQDIIEQMVKLPVDMFSIYANTKGIDRNKELRAAARKRLGLPPEEENDS